MSPIDRDQLETTGTVLAIVAALWAFFKWLVTPLAVTATRTALTEEIKALREIATALSGVAERLNGHERRITMLEERDHK